MKRRSLFVAASVALFAASCAPTPQSASLDLHLTATSRYPLEVLAIIAGARRVEVFELYPIQSLTRLPNTREPLLPVELACGYPITRKGGELHREGALRVQGLLMSEASYVAAPDEKKCEFSPRYSLKFHSPEGETVDAVLSSCETLLVRGPVSRTVAQIDPAAPELWDLFGAVFPE